MAGRFSPLLAVSAAFLSLAAHAQPAEVDSIVAESCVWPNCTTTCDVCKPVPYETCLLPKIGTSPCGDHAHCSNHLCYCDVDSCHFPGHRGCTPVSCTTGARPPPWKPTLWAIRMAELASPFPQTADDEQWNSWTRSTILYPALIMILGIVVAIFVWIYVHGVEHHTCLDCLPPTPYLLIGMSILAILVVIFGIIMNYIAMLNIFRVARDRLDHFHDDMLITKEHSNALHATISNMSHMLNNLPRTCDNALFRAGAEKAVAKGGPVVNEAFEKVAKVNRMVNQMEHRVAKVQGVSWAMEQFMLCAPTLPVVLMFAVTLGLVGVVMVSWIHHDPKVADKADDAFFLYGGCCITLLITSTALLAAITLWAGIAEGSMCIDVDTSLTDLVDSINFTEVGNVSDDTDKMIDQVFSHYILGDVSNPVTAEIEGLERQVTQMDALWKKASVMIEAASAVCHGFKTVDVTRDVATLQNAMRSMVTLLRASNVWPYYRDIMHHIICGSLLESNGYVVILNVLVGCVFFPALAVIAHADLDRWAHWKSQNGLGSNGRHQRAPRGFLRQKQKKVKGRRQGHSREFTNLADEDDAMSMASWSSGTGSVGSFYDGPQADPWQSTAFGPGETQGPDSGRQLARAPYPPEYGADYDSGPGDYGADYGAPYGGSAAYNAFSGFGGAFPGSARSMAASPIQQPYASGQQFYGDAFQQPYAFQQQPPLPGGYSGPYATQPYGTLAAGGSLVAPYTGGYPSASPYGAAQPMSPVSSPYAAVQPVTPSSGTLYGPGGGQVSPSRTAFLVDQGPDIFPEPARGYASRVPTSTVPGD